MRKKVGISLAVLFFGIIGPFIFDWIFSIHHEWYTHRYGLDDIIFIWMILGGAISVALNDMYRRLAKFEKQNSYHTLFTFVEALAIALFFGSLVFAYLAISLRGIMFL